MGAELSTSRPEKEKIGDYLCARNYGGTQAFGYALRFVERSDKLGQACDFDLPTFNFHSVSFCNIVKHREMESKAWIRIQIGESIKEKLLCKNSFGLNRLKVRGIPEIVFPMSRLINRVADQAKRRLVTTSEPAEAATTYFSLNWEYNIGTLCFPKLRALGFIDQPTDTRLDV
ncbi:hypothetical protein Syun_019128 [Stephania yunnanensis]|uniref:Uncharacterized protein n=1 Tax=Stephania yunnanensis TaxID=152371 RepID=A0AAP0NZ42_9MAGN